MRSLDDELDEAMENLRSRGLDRHLRPPVGIDFSSNDYLGLSRDPRIAQRVRERLGERAPFGAPASRLLRGNLEDHVALEERIAGFKGTESALLFPSGYQANLGLLTALLGPRDRVLSDELNHASIIDGLRLSGARKVIFRHRDPAALEELVREPHQGGRTVVVTESLFSMEGDIAPLDDYAEIATRHGALLVVDDAHATGLYGNRRGSGLAEHFGVEREAAAIVSTFGKALGISGAFVAGSRALTRWLVHTARSFIYTTALSPLIVYAIDAALDVLLESPALRLRVRELAGRIRTGLRLSGFDVAQGDSPIVPVVLGANEAAVDVASELVAAGFDVRAVRPPSVPEGTARLRISVHADRSEAEIDALARAVSQAVGKRPNGGAAFR